VKNREWSRREESRRAKKTKATTFYSLLSEQVRLHVSTPKALHSAVKNNRPESKF